MKLIRIQTIAFLTLVNNEVIRFIRIWPQTLLPSAITMTLYFLIFGSFIGQRVGRIEDVPYMSFIMPGLVMMSIIMNAYANVVSSFYSVRFIRCIDELLIAPISNWLILCGFLTGGILRGLLVGAIVMGVSLFFTHLSIHHIGITLLIVFLTSTLFSLAGFTNGIFARKFDDISIIPTFVLTPLTYLGGVFYSIHQLPESLRVISLFNPILYMVNAFREGMLGITDVPILHALLIITAVIVFLFILNIYLLRKGVGIKN